MTPMFTPDELLSVKSSPVLVILGQCFEAEVLEAYRRAENTNARLRGEALIAAWRARQPKSPTPPPEPSA